MKQDDYIMHSYTVAKARDSTYWDTEIVGVTCKEKKEVKYKLVTCTYHCG